MGGITFHFDDIPAVHLFPSDRVAIWLGHVCAQENRRIDYINIVFCSDERLLQLNQQYLGHDSLTDILTFPYDGEQIQSDVYISLDRVNENSIRYSSQEPTREVLRVMVHGILHLCRYDDQSAEEKQIMKTKEDFYLQQYLNEFSE